MIIYILLTTLVLSLITNIVFITYIIKTHKYNTSDDNTGYYNTGKWNTGKYNTGDGNTSKWSTGNYNTGDYNTGNCNTGYRNTGYYNTGNLNIGNYNTGDYNTGDYNTGHFNTITPEKILVFNKPCKRDDWKNTYKPQFLFFKLTEWIEVYDMSNQEKKDHPEYTNTGGYLKSYDYKEAFKKSWDNADYRDKLKIFCLPNFDPEIFYEISGIDCIKPVIKIINFINKYGKII